MPKYSQRSGRIAPSEITSYGTYLSRRTVLAGCLGLAAAQGAGSRVAKALAAEPARAADGLRYVLDTKYSVAERPNTFEEISTYNNYYEFGTDKSDPAKNARNFRTKPWSVAVGGEAEVTGTFQLEDILQRLPLQERVYRFRCVEAWSMVIPWVGVPLMDVLRRFKPTSRAKFVEFKTLYDPRQMPGERVDVLPWPYVEGLRIDEAMHPLAMLVVGLYGKVLPNQNGAPLRLMVPWKYGFKNIKAIVGIRFTQRQPHNTWAISSPGEYGFYANVNPQVDHPRWSQATERRIGNGLFAPRIPTLMFNGYAEQVADLYRGMDLRTNF